MRHRPVWLLLLLVSGTMGQNPHDTPKELRGLLQDPRVRAAVTGQPAPDSRPAPASRPARGRPLQAEVPGSESTRASVPDPEPAPDPLPVPPLDSGAPPPRRLFDGRDRPRLFLEVREDPQAPTDPPLPAESPAAKPEERPGAGGSANEATPSGPARPAPAPRPAERAASALAPGGAGPIRSSRLEQPAGEAEAARLLARMLDSLGGPDTFHGLGTLGLQLRISVFDPVGGEIFSVRAAHQALLDRPGADRVDYQDGRVLGRRGTATWVRTGGVERPDLSARAAMELEGFAFLARFPFLLADRDRFTPVQAGRVHQGGEERLELVVDEDGGERLLRHMLYLDPTTFLPRELILERGERRQRIFLPERDWKLVGGVRLPWRKVVLTEAGSPSMEIAIEAALAGDPIPASRFLR